MTEEPFSRTPDAIEIQILHYAGLIVRRGLVCNSLGAIAVREGRSNDKHTHIYTKRQGISLEEMTLDDICITNMDGGTIRGYPPSIGHRLNRAVMRERKDVGAIIHLHVDEVIAFFAATKWMSFQFVSDDVPLVLGAWPHILEKNVNVEKDVELVPSFIHKTNLFVMPNHGVTSLGETVSEAYHRMCSFVAEVRRISHAMLLAQATGRFVEYLPRSEVDKMFADGRMIIYG